MDHPTSLETSVMVLKHYIKANMSWLSCRPEFEQLQQIAAKIEHCSIKDINRIGDFFEDGIVIFGRTGTILYVNKANEELFGIPWAECVGNNASDFCEDNIWIENATTYRVFETKKAYASITIPKRTGKRLLETGFPLFSTDGEFEGVIIFDRDITEHMRIKEALEATQDRLAKLEEIGDIQKQMIDLLSKQTGFEGECVCESAVMKSTVREAQQAAKSDATVLLLGETGSGKEVMADIIHRNSNRNDKPCIKVNCSAIPESLIESELFGYEKGAFTGADPKGKSGMFELANNGTLLLDEIGELPMSFQPKLLRVLQSKQVMRIGGTRVIDLDVRIIASTNRDLKKMVADNQFREDLYYRINILPIDIPPLRDRQDDIRVLTSHYLNKFNKKYGKQIIIDPIVYYNIKSYRWPGNIRELENLIERWVVIFEPYTVLQWEQVKHAFIGSRETAVQESGHPFKSRTMSEITADFQREVLLWANAEYKSPRTMAEALGVDRSTIVKMAQRLNVSMKKD